MDGRETQLSSSGTKRGGWITFPFIIGQPLSLSLSNTYRICLDQYISYFYLYQAGAVAGFTLGGGGWISNLIVYLIQVFNLKNINAAQISNIVNGSTNLLPVIGAIVADSFFGTFSVAAVSVCISLLGHKCFSCYRTYVMILCNWLIL